MIGGPTPAGTGRLIDTPPLHSTRRRPMTDHLDDGLRNPSRRTFLKATGAAALGAPAIASAADKAGTKNAIIGEGEHRYEAIHDWGELPGPHQVGRDARRRGRRRRA